MSGALQAAYQNLRSFGTAPGSQSYTTAGTYSFVVPAGVTKVSVVAIGSGGRSNVAGCAYCPCTSQCLYYGGSGGGGGGLAYGNNISVTPGASIAVQVGNTTGVYCGGGTRASYWQSTAALYALAGSGGRDNGTAGGSGGLGQGTLLSGSSQGGAGGNTPFSVQPWACANLRQGGGGGAGGYLGYGGGGGTGGISNIAGTNPTGCSGGGGGGGPSVCYSTYGRGGGGVGIFGKGSCGTGSAAGSGGTGGSSGTAGVISGGCYGGGAGGAKRSAGLADGGSGAVRIIWPGNTRSFPSTCAGSP